jgi:hypothetical protein
MTTGLKFNGTPEQEHAAARYAALRARGVNSEFEAEATVALQLAEKLRPFATEARLRAFVPPRSTTRLASPDRFVVLVDDRPWWRAHLALLCASFAEFEDVGSTWEWNTSTRDFETALVGPPAAVLEAQVLYAGLSFAVATKLPMHYVRMGMPDLAYAWIWGALVSVQNELTDLVTERDREKRAAARNDPNARTAMVHVPAPPVIEGMLEEPAIEKVGEVPTNAAPKPTGTPTIEGMLEDLATDTKEVAAFRHGASVRGIVRLLLHGPPKTLPWQQRNVALWNQLDPWRLGR